MKVEFSKPAESSRDSVSEKPILIIEDETLFARAVAKSLKNAGHDAVIATSLAAGREKITSINPHLVLLDLRLPDGSGLELLGELRAIANDVPVIVVTAFGEVADAVRAMKLGAADYLKKPVDLNELLIAVGKVMQTQALKNQLDYSRERDRIEPPQLIGESGAIVQVRNQITHLASLGNGGTQPTVLILGETGTGKDVAARLLHVSGPRAPAPFVHVDCAALPRELIESELFGHERGAYTGAHGARTGLIEAAENGTLYLDEIGELPLELQAKLLNVIERRKTRRLGSVREHPVNARFIASTNRDLPKMAAAGSFRPDLYYRLNVVGITMPTLRGRSTDVLLLAKHYAAQVCRRYGLPQAEFEGDALDAMKRYSWPGNVRELKHLVERAVLLSRGKPINQHDLALDGEVLASDASPLAGMTLDAAERWLIERALKSCGNNVSEAARRLGVSRMTLRYRIGKHGMSEN
ncbi:MAG: sigma-54-dependent transcriptional regulator [Burkholderiales bacterium]